MAEQRLYRTVADAIRGMITSGAYPPGSRLPGERELADQLGVSRVVVREAEISLETLGLVERRVGAGVYVCEPSGVYGGQLPKVTAFELTQTRLLFESECAALAATVITDDQLDNLRRSIDEMAQATPGSGEGEAADKQFHLQIAHATGNVANVFFLQTLWQIRSDSAAVRTVYGAVCATGNDQRVKEHQGVLDALVARDAQASREAMRHHFSRLFEALLDATERQAIAAAREATSAARERFLKSAIMR